MLELHFLDGNHFLISRFCVVSKHGYAFEFRYDSKKNVFWMPKELIALYYRIDNSFNDFREITGSEGHTPKVQRTIFARRIHLNVKPHWSVHSNNIRLQCFQIV